MANGSTRKGARGRPSSTKRTAKAKKTGVATTTVSRPSSRSGGRTTGRVATGKTGTRKRPSEREKTLAAQLAMPIKTVEVRPVSKRYVERERGASVSTPFYSDAHRAHVIEYSEPDKSVPGGSWESRIYASHPEDIMAMYEGVKDVVTRQQWLEKGHSVAKQLNKRDGSWFLYRTMMGERAERIRDKGM